ncbi:MAG TPA: histidinol dehydrogenase [Methanococcaceae archaeon]|uniref:Histidinol dehydrogenase n=1 Tax=Methanothermococcus okinawensis TaxID=155863 RepID=A0A832ZHE4_9EURY|nr:histidinol dehydrogenase [Methanococcaceae archaeon]HIP91245.1 histidinol dehydrogenase [Methanothermococcus okinawensis]
MIVKGIKDLTEEERYRIINRNRMNLEEILPTVKEILDNVKRRGDEALREYTRKFDKVDIEDFRVYEEEIERAYDKVDSKVISAIERAYENIKRFHEMQLEGIREWEMERDGITTGQIVRPIGSAGCYIPGGRAFYPSTVLMTVVPAKVAGVKKIVIVSPPSGGEMNPVNLVASHIAGADEIYKVGGAQAIGALAYGTETIPKVDIIVGPGNIYVTGAKMLVSGSDVKIDFPAGPSEVLIICDESARDEYVAMDLLAQGEHDPNSSCILLTTSREKALSIRDKVLELLRDIERRDILESSLKNMAFLYGDITECIEFSNEYAPEHLEIITENPREILRYIEHAGSVFLGEYAPVPVGDYATGTNHVLPTGGCARMYSGLSVDHFIKKISIQELSREGLENISETVITLAEVEGLYNHARAVKIRLKNRMFKDR